MNALFQNKIKKSIRYLEMIYRRDIEQQEFIGLEKWRFIYSKQKLSILEKSWANVFRKHILPEIPVEPLLDFFSKNRGRKSKELYTVVGSLLLQQFFNLTDEETCNELSFNQLWHFALECFDEKDQIICPKTIWTMRTLVVNLDLSSEIMKKVVDHLIKYYDIDISKQRLDSVHVHSNMAKLGRIRILARTIVKFLENLKRKHSALFNEMVSQDIKDKYLKKKNKSYFSERIKPTEAAKTLQQLGEDIYSLIVDFGSDEQIIRMNSYKLIQRVFSEQCLLEDDAVKIKPSKEVSSDSLQNPSDPDASYDGHKGQGFQTQIMETYRDDQPENSDRNNDGVESDESGKKAKLNIITHAKTEPAHLHDSQALEPALKDLQDRGIEIKQVLADTAYGSNENKEQAKEDFDVELIAPIPGKPAKNNLNKFDFDPDTLDIIACPFGKQPDEIKNNKKSTKTAIWNTATCATCEMSDNCITSPCKKGRKINYSLGSATSTIRRLYEESNEFKDNYRYRSGVEATISRFIMMTSARRMRYRGLKKMNFAQKMRALAINMFRVVKYLRKIS
jgi:hypothetical protein